MLIEALHLPLDVEGTGRKTVVIIDVLRTSSTLVAMLDSGARNIVVAGNVDEARAHAKKLKSCLLCGETGGSRPPDFDYGNSPADYRRLVLEGRQLVFTSSNGARAMTHLMSEGRRLFVGAFPNATAVVEVALADALNRSADIVFVASGRNHGTRYGIEDSTCAGFLVQRLVRRVLGDDRWAGALNSPQPRELNERWTLEDSAIIASRLYTSYGGNVEPVLCESGDAGIMRTLGLQDDFSGCLLVDISKMVPEVTRTLEGHLLVNPAPLL